MDTKKNNKIIIVFLILLIIGLVSYIAYDYYQERKAKDLEVNENFHLVNEENNNLNIILQTVENKADSINQNGYHTELVVNDHRVIINSQDCLDVYQVQELEDVLLVTYKDQVEGLNSHYVINNKGKIIMNLNEKISDRISDVSVKNNSITISTIKGYSLDQPLTMCNDYKDNDIVANNYQMDYLSNEKFSELKKISSYDLKTYLKEEFNFNSCEEILEKYPNYIIN